MCRIVMSKGTWYVSPSWKTFASFTLTSWCKWTLAVKVVFRGKGSQYTMPREFHQIESKTLVGWSLALGVGSGCSFLSSRSKLRITFNELLEIRKNWARLGVQEAPCLRVIFLPPWTTRAELIEFLRRYYLHQTPDIVCDAPQPLCHRAWEKREGMLK